MSSETEYVKIVETGLTLEHRPAMNQFHPQELPKGLCVLLVFGNIWAFFSTMCMIK